MRHNSHNTLGQLKASSLQHVLRRLDKSFTAFFRRLKTGQKPGLPRFKSRNRFRSFEYTIGTGCKQRQDERRKLACCRMSFYVQNVAQMRMCYHRAIPQGANIKHAVIKQVNERWYVCLMLEVPEAVEQRAPTGNQVGIEVGLKSLTALSTGERIDNPRWLRASLAKLCRLQRHASRQVKGSSRQRKTYRQVARLHEKVSNQRRDYLHKISKALAAKNDLIAIENLSLGFMNRNGHLHDAGFGLFRQILEYKAEEAGIQVFAGNPSNTTRACSRCGSIVPKGLSVRVHSCPDCGIVLDRDVNAARKFLSVALPLRRSGQVRTCPVGESVA